ncbi:MAG TPA: magnesium-translocating P-type ATPase [Moraxellaceae bacterium]|nr:magnesium-translocating P-type ATPase [Moraxellaceae bacterium]
MLLDSLTRSVYRLVEKSFPRRYFQRQDVLESLQSGGRAPDGFLRQRRELALATTAVLLTQFGSHPDGLTGLDAAARRAESGANEVQHDRPLPWWHHLWICYRNPFNILLTLLAVVSWLTEDATATVVIGTMVLVSTVLRFVQEGRSNRAADRLKEMVSNTATVLRRANDDGETGAAAPPHGARREEVPIRELVPGDMVLLSAGDMIPADLRVLSAKDLFVSQAALTGESLPVEKFAVSRHPGEANALELDTLCFMGTNVVSGSATAMVIGTGASTYFGSLAQRVVQTDRAPTAFQSGVNRVSWLLIRFMLVMAPVVLVINGLTKHDWLEAALFALSIAVGLTPEMLPMIVTSTLAKGAVLLSRKKVIVKRLDAIQNFGAMDVLCTDKTGTLTQDRIFLERYTNAAGEVDDEVLEYAYLNSFYQTGLKNLLDVAVLEHAELQLRMGIAGNFRKVDEIPFDFERRRMSVVVSERDDHHLIVCKGALDEMLSVCSRQREGEGVVPMTPERLTHLREMVGGLNQEGLRVVAVAVRELPPTRESYGVADESDLTLVGFVAFLDPPKESTAPALRELKAHGVDVKILTGDNELVTAKICREVGVPVSGLLTGAQIESMDDATLGAKVEQGSVFARLTPAHKERIVSLLRQRGHVVGFLGDGINDAPALRAADIGISVDTAVDIAKEAADVILLEKSLMVLSDGVLEGRKTFINMLKYIKMTASSNFGNVFSVLIASIFLPFLPMLPLQLLVQNLMYDISQIAIPFDNVDAAQLKGPQRWNTEDIGRFMLFFGPVSSVFDIVTFAVLWYVFGANSPEHQTLFQSGWFVEGLVSQLLVVHLIRSRRLPFLQSRAAWPLMGMTLLVMAVGFVLPLSPFAGYFKMQALPPSYFVWLAGILLAYMTLAQGMKAFYARRFGWQ